MKNTDFGQVKISNDVVSTIASLAALEVDGAEKANKFADKIFGNNGVKVTIEEDNVIVDVVVNVRFGNSIPKVCEEIQENVINTIETMTGLVVSTVNVHVQGISLKKDKEDQKR